ncbi:MAG: catalase-peroxidase, partial [Alphaproteobacteria bacterium]
DKRGGANGGRIRLEPQRSWPVNNPSQVDRVVTALEQVQAGFNGKQAGGKKVSFADLVVLGGCAAVEQAAKQGGVDVTVPFTPGRMDTTQEHTDVEQFNWLQPVSDGFRNYHRTDIGYNVPSEQIFLDRAALLSLSAPEWTALTGGLRVLDVNWDGSKHGVFTDRPGVLTSDFFKHLTTMDLEWEKADAQGSSFALNDRETGQTKFTGTRCDLIFGSNSQLRQVAEVYAADDGHGRLVHDFVAAWHKVMMLDRYDVKRQDGKLSANDVQTVA